MIELKPCPFCAGKLNFYRENYVNRFGKRVIEQTNTQKALMA